MKLSELPDPLIAGEHPATQDIQVFVDGVMVPLCYACSVSNGWADTPKLHEGKRVIDPANHCIVTERLRGVVTLEYQGDEVTA